MDGDTPAPSKRDYDFRKDFSAISLPGVSKVLVAINARADNGSFSSLRWLPAKAYILQLWNTLRSLQHNYREFGIHGDAIFEMYNIRDWTRESVQAYVDQRLDEIIESNNQPRLSQAEQRARDDLRHAHEAACEFFYGEYSSGVIGGQIAYGGSPFFHCAVGCALSAIEEVRNRNPAVWDATLERVARREVRRLKRNREGKPDLRLVAENGVALEDQQHSGIVPDSQELPLICAATFAGKAVPEQDWMVPGLIPGKAVTLLSGDGGVGKSTLIAQLGVAAPVGGVWIGTQPKRGPVIFVSAEDSDEEIHRRLFAIAAAQAIDLADLTDLYIVPLAGRDAVMGAPKVKGGPVVQTAVWGGLVHIVKRVKPVLIILDNLADVFGGNEIVRAEARQFISQLSGLAIEQDLAVVVLAHPSLTGLNSGSGTSGSTAWSNSVRSRLYFKRVGNAEGGDPDLRALQTMKANYAPTGDQIQLRWFNGCFVREGGSVKAGGLAEAIAVGALSLAEEKEFLDLIGEFAKQGRNVSPNNRASNYAPKVFAEYRGGKGKSALKYTFKKVMDRLFREARIHAAPDGPASKGRLKLIIGAPPEENSKKEDTGDE
jgi:RecA-family ATPase